MLTRCEGALTFARESLLANRAELEPLFEKHWADVTPDFANTTLGFDWETYECLERDGKVHLMCCRDNGVLVGYQLVVGQRHLHSKETQVGTTTLFYMLPEYRSGWNGVKLFKESAQSLKALGIQTMYVGCKADHDLAPIFVRLGYHHVETVYAKVL